MKKKKCFLIIILVAAFNLNAQNPDLLISGNFQGLPFISFIKELEQKYPVSFFFEKRTIEDIIVTANFNNTPLRICLESILHQKSLGFYIAENNQVTIYSGFALKSIFPVSDTLKGANEESTSSGKFSKEELNRLQYQIFNIGIPGGNKSKVATLSGFLKNNESREPVVGGNVFIAQTQRGVTTDKNGFYKITLPVGNQTLLYSCVGMEPVKRIINLYSDGRLDVELETKVNLLEGVVVIGHGNGNLGQVHSGLEKIDLITLKSIPALFGEADVIKSLLTLPGVQTVGEGTSGFSVRGGNTDQNLILIDQAPIYYPSHFFGIFSAINSDIIKDATLYKGSIPIQYGGRISSVFEINTKDGNPDKVSGSAGISPVSAGINLDGPFFLRKSTFVTSFRSTYSNWLLSRIKVPELYNSKVSFYDVFAKLDLYLNEKNNMTVSIYRSKDKFQLHSDTTYAYNNTIYSLLLKHNFNSQLKSNTALIYSSFNYDISSQSEMNQAFSLTHSLTDIVLKNDFEYITNRSVKYNFGGEINLYSVNPGDRIPGEESNITPITSGIERAMEYAIFAGSEFSLASNLKIEGGIRLSGLISFGDGESFIYAKGLPLDAENIIDTLFTGRNSIEKTYFNPEFRLSANYTLNGYSSLKLSYNKTAQYIHQLTNTTAISPTDTWKLSDKYLLPETGHQLSTGYFRNFLNMGIETSVEVFYKWIYNIEQYKAGANLLLNDHIETEIINGKGKSYGLEFSLEKTKGRIYGRIDYTYSRTLIKSVTDFPTELINDGEYFPANYDKPHSLNILANLKAYRRLIFSVTANYSTGRPITYPVAKYMIGNQVFLHYSKYNQYRIPDYFRTDVSVTINGNLKKRQLTHGTLIFSLYNVTGRRNVYSVYFSSEGEKFNAYKLSVFGTIIPTLTYNIRF